MKKITLLALILLVFAASSVFAKTWIVDQNGLGYCTSISAAINVAGPGDVVKVHPGIYNEKVVINKDILVEGSGAENTMISNQNKDCAVEISAGKIRWFNITSAGTGVKASGGILTNCIISNCSVMGVDCYNGIKIINCLAIGNQYHGFYIKKDQEPIIYNCIACYSTNGRGFDVESSYDDIGIEFCNSWGNGKANWRHTSRAFLKYYCI